MNKKTKIFLTVMGIILILIGSFVGIKTVLAEQLGGSPNNDPTTSYIKQLYTNLVSLSFGSDTDTPDWGTYWNRIKTSATWVPDTSNNAAAGDVAVGKKFYAGDNRTEITGTSPAPESGGLSKTGQTTSYTDYDDGYYQKGLTHTFSDDSTLVTDNYTQLMWPKAWNSAGANNGSSFANWQAAITYCEGLDFGGHTDWRLPNRLELESVIDFSRYNPVTYSVFTNVATNHYWTSTSNAGAGAGWAWDIYMYNSNIASSDKTGSGIYGVCVRGGL